MAYLTNSAFFRLANQIEFEEISHIDIDFFYKEIYDDKGLYYFFNQLDLKNLFNTKRLLETEDFTAVVHRKVSKRPDERRFIYTRETAIKYHLFQDCEALNRGFRDFRIPEDIKDIDDDEFKEEIIEELRDWFKENNFTRERLDRGEIRKETIIMRYNNKFPVEYGELGVKRLELNSNLLIVDIKSSGVTEVDRFFDIAQFRNNLENLKRERYNLINSFYNGTTIISKENLNKMSKNDYLINKTDWKIENELNRIIGSEFSEYLNHRSRQSGMIIVKSFLRRHYKMKQKVRNLLLDYFKWKYDLKNKDYDIIFLEDFNIECCKYCSDRKNKNDLFE